MKYNKRTTYDTRKTEELTKGNTVLFLGTYDDLKQVIKINEEIKGNTNDDYNQRY